MAYTREHWTKEQSVYTRIHNSIFDSGLVTTIGRGRVMTLLAIAKHMKDNGKAWPTQETLAKMTGVSVRTIRDDIKFLRDFEINGKPILKAVPYITPSGHTSYVYKIMPISQLSKFRDGKLDYIPQLVHEEDSKESGLLSALDQLDD
ncbi:helix-turn-helix domain-containing protein [Priestia megaterium]|uniref:helix-turn-helix domain-containing protein n=1 Tax=Priestia megaterium TaxID=1404 RepID=UPI00372D4DCB